jgi:hypothetical protein
MNDKLHRGITIEEHRKEIARLEAQRPCPGCGDGHHEISFRCREFRE